MTDSIQEIHLIHHSHTDFGYTDLASTAMALHVDFIRQAVEFADATVDYPEDARFRWTCESALITDAFLRQATGELKSRFDAAVNRGQIEVAAVPYNITGLMNGPEWDEVERRLGPIWKKYGACVAMQNDINGFPWGLLPRLQSQGIGTFWIGCNGDTSIPLTPVPDAWWWEGSDGKRMLVWSGTHYCFGFELFHAAEWRRGPVPSATEVWYNPPSSGETWNTSNENLAAAEQILHTKLAAMGHYKHAVVAFQVTNMWRMDNDPPSRQLADFVKAWNDGGSSPRLVMSTPTRFLKRLLETAGDKITSVHRGDWQDWWSDGICTAPELLVANQQAKRILGDLRIHHALRDVGHHAERDEYDEAWSNAILFDEHTWGSYNSIAQPYHPRSMGGFAEKAVFAYRAVEQAKLARTAMFRKAKDYTDFSRTRCFRVLNPGTTVRSGWIEIPATSIRFECNAVREIASGKVYPLESLRDPEWSEPNLELAPYDRPNDVWSWNIKIRRFFLANLAPHQTIDFELVETPQESSPNPPAASAQRLPVSRKECLKFEYNDSTGRITSLKTHDGTELIDVDSPHGLGQLVVESLKDRGQRYILAKRDQALLTTQFRDEPVKLVSTRREATPYADTIFTAWEHPLVERVEQRWDILHDTPRVMSTTTIWTKEITDPCGIYLAFPFAVPNAEFVYDSAGTETVFGRDNMPGTCAEALCHNSGLIVRNPGTAILLGTPDTPLGCVGGPMLRRRLLSPYAPGNAHYYVNVANNYWHTNFSIMKAGKLVVHHWIEPVATKEASLAMLSDELWAYPIATQGAASCI